MSINRFCAYCGAPIPPDPERKFCSSCGKPLPALEQQQENELSIDIGSKDASAFASEASASVETTVSTETSYKKGWWQTAAALLFLLLILSDFILGYLFPYQYYVEYEIYRYESILMIIGWLLLVKSANNQATMVAAVVFIMINLLSAALDNNLVPGHIVVYAVLLLICCYAISLIMNNNEMCSSNRVWCNFMPVLWASTIVLYLTGPVAQLVMPQMDKWGYFLTPEELSEKINTCRMSSFMYLGWFNFIRIPLYACAMWMLARSEAFTGNYDKDAVCNYSPMNKYVAAALIAPAIVILSFIVLYFYNDAFPS